MAIDEIVNMMKLRDEADRITETGRILAAKAYIAASEKILGDDGLVDYKKLADKTTLDTYTDALTASLAEATDTISGATTGDGLRGRINRVALQTEYFGINTTELKRTVEGKGAGLTTGFLTSLIFEKSEDAAKARLNSVYEGMGPNKAPMVREYLGSKGVSVPEVLDKVAWDRATAPVLAGLLETLHVKKAVGFDDIPTEYRL